MPISLKNIIVPEDASIRTAMEAIDRGAVEIALVVAVDGKLSGTLTDGDVRRALLGGARLEEQVKPFVQRQFTAVGPSTSRAEVLDLMRARSLEQIPIVEKGGKVTGLHLLREILGAEPRPNWAVVMAGGRGQRLRPITDSIPKPMIRVAGRPILERIVLHLVGFGVRQIYLSINYMGEKIQEHFGDGAAFGCRIAYLREEKPLGTGGALSLLPTKPEDPLLVLNGDLLTQLNIASLLAYHADGGYKATVAVHDHAYTVPFGVIEKQDDDSVSCIHEKPVQTWLVNAGIYVLDPDLPQRVPEGSYFPMNSLFEECLDRGERLGAFPIREDWADVGRHGDLQRARGEGVGR